jgi:hypothetical protein
MALNSLMNSTDEALRSEHRRRLWMGTVVLLLTLLVAYMAAHQLLDSAEGSAAFGKLVILLAVQAAAGLAVISWMTRPMQERDRRKRVILKQAIGAFPELDG